MLSTMTRNRAHRKERRAARILAQRQAYALGLYAQAKSMHSRF